MSEFPVPFSGIKWEVSLNEQEFNKALDQLLRICRKNGHYHNFAIKLDDERPTLLLSDTAKECVFNSLSKKGRAKPPAKR